MDWEKLFDASSLALSNQLEEARAGMQHRTMKGTVAEHSFSRFLRRVLPGSIALSTGEVIDSKGGRSKQCDVIIHDAATTPYVLSQHGLDVLPIEPVFGVIEVKTYLNKQELQNSFGNMLAIKSLEKAAFATGPVGVNVQYSTSMYGVEMPFWPVQFYVFAYESDGLETIFGHLKAMNSANPHSRRIDGICILDKGLIIHAGPDGLEPVSAPHATLISKPSLKPLLPFSLLLSHLYGQVFTRPMSLLPYMSHIKL